MVIPESDSPFISGGANCVQHFQGVKYALPGLVVKSRQGQVENPGIAAHF